MQGTPHPSLELVQASEEALDAEVVGGNPGKHWRGSGTQGTIAERHYVQAPNGFAAPLIAADSAGVLPPVD